MLKDIENLLDKLKYRGMASIIEKTLDDAKNNQMAISEVILNLLHSEYKDRQERALQNRLKTSRPPWNWTLDSFPFKDQPGVNKASIMELAKLNFMERKENIIFIGEPGTGKSGLAMGLLHTAILNGYRGRFYYAQDLLDELYTSLADRTSAKLLNQINNFDLLVIDELGFISLNTEQVNMFFKLIEIRYRKKPTIITTNLPFEKWYDVFKNKSLVDAMLDRYRHYCTTIYIDGPSLRAPDNNIIKKANKAHDIKAQKVKKTQNQKV